MIKKSNKQRNVFVLVCGLAAIINGCLFIELKYSQPLSRTWSGRPKLFFIKPKDFAPYFPKFSNLKTSVNTNDSQQRNLQPPENTNDLLPEVEQLQTEPENPHALTNDPSPEVEEPKTPPEQPKTLNNDLSLKIEQPKIPLLPPSEIPELNRGVQDALEATIPVILKEERRQKTLVCEILADAIIKHFPHFSETLFDCWSHLRVLPTPHKCVLYFSQWKEPLTATWSTQMMGYVNCEQIYEKPKKESYDAYIKVGSILSRNSWFQSKNDAIELTKLILGPENYQKSLTSEKLRIGFVQREKSRIILNLTSLVEIVEEQYPDAIIKVEKFADMNLRDQVEWYANQDLIIAAHGAGLTNLAFAHECVVVFQLYCEGYYVPFYFNPLLKDVGGIMFEYYDGDEYNIHFSQTHRERYLARQNNIAISQEVLLENIKQMIAAREKCYENI